MQCIVNVRAARRIHRADVEVPQIAPPGDGITLVVGGPRRRRQTPAHRRFAGGKGRPCAFRVASQCHGRCTQFTHSHARTQTHTRTHKLTHTQALSLSLSLSLSLLMFSPPSPHLPTSPSPHCPQLRSYARTLSLNASYGTSCSRSTTSVSVSRSPMSPRHVFM